MIGVRRASAERTRGRPLRRLSQKPLLNAVDHGRPVVVPPGVYAPPLRDGGWGTYIDAFVRFNRDSLDKVNTAIDISSDTHGTVVRLVPGGAAGAIPLRSGQTGQVCGGLLVAPRFGWAGVGEVLNATGWHTAPNFIDSPLVPGSDRVVPAWVLAGPTLARIEALLKNLSKGFAETEEVLTHPRGQIVWSRYRAEFLPRGRWNHVPCRFPELTADPKLRRHVRWALDKIHGELVSVGAGDPLAFALATKAAQLAASLGNLLSLFPRSEDLRRMSDRHRLRNEVFLGGIEALRWVAEERGLGGGREMDGLAWSLSLDQLWEAYVEAIIRAEAGEVGAEVKVGRLKETTFPVHWSDSLHRSLGHLEPDIVVRRGRQIRIVDAKYKAHFAELDETGWRRMSEDIQHSHRADFHQVLAYAALFDADDITATLVYPLRQETYDALHARGRDVAHAFLRHGGRALNLELRGMPFGLPSRSARL